MQHDTVIGPICQENVSVGIRFVPQLTPASPAQLQPNQEGLTQRTAVMQRTFSRSSPQRLNTSPNNKVLTAQKSSDAPAPFLLPFDNEK